MRLSHIKLAGFKSFVDPTHIPVPGHLVGVVGPNGCGKSNVIDAVRWVLGESSARHLRGETMQDVIFNGSGERKPANRASVELVFDNSLGKAGGPWASYGEISVKRVLERDGESAYYINNQHVRRRDVADIFLGTGLGGRAYAIIEQGMISRIVEARPEELRTFLEEAAGISRYRERRRETEQRLEDTRENLARVDDILQELNQQVEHLEQQAEVAARYRTLEAEQKTKQHLLWLLRRQEAANQRQRLARDLDQLAVDLEAETARLRELESNVEHLRVAHFAASDVVHAAQGALYEVNAEAARLEQALQHLRDSRRRVDGQIAAVRRDQEEAEAHAQQAQGSLAAQTADLERAAAALESCQADEREDAQRLPSAEARFAETRAELDRLNQELAQVKQEDQAERLRRDHAERVLGQLAQRGERLEQEAQSLREVDAEELQRLALDIAELEHRHRAHRDALDDAERALPALETAQRELADHAEAAARDVSGLEARRAALELLQRQVSRSGEMHAWLDNHELDGLERLWHGVRIEPGWEDALEAVLRERLNAIKLEELQSAARWIADAPPGKVSFFQGSLHAAPLRAKEGFMPLLSYIAVADHGVAAVLADWLDGVYVVADPETGLAQCADLAPGTLLVCPQGHIFTRTSVSFHAADTEIHGILSRQREIEGIDQACGAAVGNLAQARDRATHGQSAVDAQRTLVQQVRRQAEELQLARHDLQLEQVRVTQQAERAAHRRAQISLELGELAAERKREEQARDTADAQLAQVEDLINGLLQRTGAAASLHEEAGVQLAAARERAQGAARRAQEAVFQKQSIITIINNLKSILDNLHEKGRRLDEKLAELGSELTQLDEGPLARQLDEALGLRITREQALARTRQGLEEAERALKDTEQQRMVCEQRLAPLRDRVGELRLKEQEVRLGEEGYAAQLAEAGADQEALAQRIEKGMRPSGLQTEINRLNEEIAALGAVNLAALDELRSGRERKDYLEAQSRDLHEAVGTLENAIRRIDRETRERLQATFDEVNRNLTQLFPALFGGGEARLMMTGEEILDAGVTVVARPPGKRNSSIHLLSGGEKALAALALVFSLFQLNPAPFCLLDEVDAPLDDANTERFCDLVKRMAAQTQFLFISHNKITMELAQQLVGVTMPEQGVSKVVAVDIEEAMRIREEAAA